MATSTRIFGESFKSSYTYAKLSMIRILENDLVNEYGEVKIEKISLISKSILWGYIFYIWTHNKDVLLNIKNPVTFRNNVKPIILNFLKNILSQVNIVKYKSKGDKLLYLTKIHLILFINNYITKYPKIKLPFISKNDMNSSKFDKDYNQLDILINNEETKYDKLIDIIENNIEKNNEKI